jgi:outer membrane protein TolC
MKRPALLLGHGCVVVTLGLGLPASAFAQAGGGSQSAPVPLSGRVSAGGAVVPTQTPNPGGTSSVSTVTPAIQVQGAFAGSTRDESSPLTGVLLLQDAIRRGLEYNLGAVTVGQAVDQARGQKAVARSALLPNLAADLTQTRTQVNLAAMGVRFEAPIPGFSFPTVVGPFNYVDLRARLSQTVVDLTALNNYRAARETVRSSELFVRDARDLVVLAVGGAYLQAVAAGGRVGSARAQLETARALYEQNAQRRAVGLVAQVDVDRSQVQALTQQQRLIALQNDLAKQKINLARMIGLPPTDQYELVEEVPFTPAPSLSIEEALRQARAQRADLQAASAQVRAAERALSAARAERLPSLVVNADYGTIGATLADARSTFTVVGIVRVPLWQGGRTEGQIQQAEAALAQRRAELQDLESQIEGEALKAELDLRASASQVDVARQNLEVAQQTLDLTRQRFEAGVSDNVEVVQAQESVASAELDYINGVFAHNLAKLTLARTIGQAADKLSEFLATR